jgi:hypothetical protein
MLGVLSNHALSLREYSTPKFGIARHVSSDTAGPLCVDTGGAVQIHMARILIVLRIGLAFGS